MIRENEKTAGFVGHNHSIFLYRGRCAVVFAASAVPDLPCNRIPVPGLRDDANAESPAAAGLCRSFFPESVYVCAFAHRRPLVARRDGAIYTGKNGADSAVLGGVSVERRALYRVGLCRMAQFNACGLTSRRIPCRIKHTKSICIILSTENPSNILKEGN